MFLEIALSFLLYFPIGVEKDAESYRNFIRLPQTPSGWEGIISSTPRTKVSCPPALQWLVPPPRWYASGIHGLGVLAVMCTSTKIVCPHGSRSPRWATGLLCGEEAALPSLRQPLQPLRTGAEQAVGEAHSLFSITMGTIPQERTGACCVYLPTMLKYWKWKAQTTTDEEMEYLRVSSLGQLDAL